MREIRSCASPFWQGSFAVVVMYIHTYMPLESRRLAELNLHAIMPCENNGNIYMASINLPTSLLLCAYVWFCPFINKILLWSFPQNFHPTKFQAIQYQGGSIKYLKYKFFENSPLYCTYAHIHMLHHLM